jgi:hypothetical protein
MATIDVAKVWALVSPVSEPAFSDDVLAHVETALGAPLHWNVGSDVR